MRAATGPATDTRWRSFVAVAVHHHGQGQDDGEEAQGESSQRDQVDFSSHWIRVETAET